MESNEQIASKKRSINMIAANELAFKFRSKQDFVDYLDQQ